LEKPRCAAKAATSPFFLRRDDAHLARSAEALAKEGIEAEVIDLRTLLPLDEETILKSVKKTNKVLVVHEDTKTGGIAGEIAAILCEKAFGDLDGPLMRVASLDTPVRTPRRWKTIFCPTRKRFSQRQRSWLVTRFGSTAALGCALRLRQKDFLATETQRTQSQRKKKSMKNNT